MKVTTEKTENRMSFLTVEMEQSEVEEYLGKSFKRMVQEVDIPGFRKGNAPRAVLEQHVGEDKLLEDAMRELVPKTCASVIREQELDAFSQPMVKVTQNEPLVFEMIVPLSPIVKLADYHKIKMKPESVEVKDKDVDATLEQIRHQYATWEPVERPVEAGDLLTIDIESTIMESPFLNRKGMRYQVMPEYTPEIPGFSDHFIGVKKDEEKEFKLKLPESYPNKVMAGKEISFKVKVLEVKEEKLPELDDSFAKTVTPDLETLDLLKERIANNMRIELEQKSRVSFEEKVVDTLVKRSEQEFPPVMLDTQIKLMVNEYLQQLQMSCRSREEYDEKLKQVPEAKLREECRPIAYRRVLWSLVLGKVAEEAKIEVSATEIDEEIEHIIEGAGGEKEGQREFLNSWQNRENIRELLIIRKTIQRLVEIAQGKLPSSKNPL